uniref:Uncharacterized protein n=1 Tax=Hyaloperonospora arabidopsidis (strain Emoy2) TaxID=559515 RepID=M4B9Y0_HYAAE
MELLTSYRATQLVLQARTKQLLPKNGHLCGNCRGYVAHILGLSLCCGLLDKWWTTGPENGPRASERSPSILR